MSQFVFEMPETLEALVNCLEGANNETYILGGGTDFIIQMRNKGISQGKIIDMTGIRGLSRITMEDDLVRIGANVSYTELAEHELIKRSVPCLAQMASKVGSTQIRNMGRLCGNLANASPAGDAIATLMALAASIKTINSKGEITETKVEDFIQGIGKTTLKRDEAIIEISFPQREQNQRSGYKKIGLSPRAEVTIANISLTMIIDYDPVNEIIQNSDIFIGSAAPKAYRAVMAEDCLKGQKPTKALAEDLGEILQKHVTASINGIDIFKHKINDIRGLAIDIYEDILADLL